MRVARREPERLDRARRSGRRQHERRIFNHGARLPGLSGIEYDARGSGEALAQARIDVARAQREHIRSDAALFRQQVALPRHGLLQRAQARLVGLRGIVEQHHVDRKTQPAPVALRQQQRVHTGPSRIDAAQQDDRAVAGNACGPQHRRTAGALRQLRRRRTPARIGIEQRREQAIEVARLLLVDAERGKPFLHQRCGIRTQPRFVARAQLGDLLQHRFARIAPRCPEAQRHAALCCNRLPAAQTEDRIEHGAGVAAECIGMPQRLRVAQRARAAEELGTVRFVRCVRLALHHLHEMRGPDAGIVGTAFAPRGQQDAALRLAPFGAHEHLRKSRMRIVRATAPRTSSA